MDFDTLLARFARAVHTRDAAGLAALFTEDGTYEDYFFGAHHGRDEIAAMLERFHVGGEAFHWEFVEPVCVNDTGYASYLFSYRSKEPESAGRLIVFEGMCRMRLREGLIAHYAEAFDRGVAFSQLGYATERTAKLLARYAAGLRVQPAIERHLAHRRARGLPV
ncbi:MAG: nuclear transport factor 2 family protein [Burkholderiales bacterium]|jgi:hypothetical protein